MPQASALLEYHQHRARLRTWSGSPAGSAEQLFVRSVNDGKVTVQDTTREGMRVLVTEVPANIIVMTYGGQASAAEAGSYEV